MLLFALFPSLFNYIVMSAHNNADMIHWLFLSYLSRNTIFDCMFVYSYSGSTATSAAMPGLVYIEKTELQVGE
jgi:hypothetical protein